MKQVLKDILKRRKRQETMGSFRHDSNKTHGRIYNKQKVKVHIEVEIPNGSYIYTKEKVQKIIEGNNFWIDEVETTGDGIHKPVTYITLQGEQK